MQRFKPIAVVRNGITEPGYHDWPSLVSEVVVDGSCAEGLEGLDTFSHVIVVFWMHRSGPPEALTCRPEGREDVPEVGLFATRSPRRPNPIGVTVCRLLGRSGAVLWVQGLDALDGTPVLDLKPYLPGDCVAEATYPDWAWKLHHEGQQAPATPATDVSTVKRAP